MRVLLINQVFHPDLQATSQYLSWLAEELAAEGHEVTVLAGRRDYQDATRHFPARETWKGIEIIRVWNAGLGHGTKIRRALDFLTFLISASMRGLFLRRADVVLALTTPPLVSVLGAILARLWRARFVYWVMDLNPDEAIAVGWLKRDAFPTRILEAFSRWSLKEADPVIALDVYMRDRLLAKKIVENKIAVISLWGQGDVKFDPAGRDRFRREHSLEDRYVVMYAGNHTPCHPLDTLTGAARLLQDEPRVHFCFVGGGSEWRTLRERAATESWKNATFLGYQPSEALAGMLSAADLQVVVMGDAFLGIIHPCKVYNIIAARRPFIYVGPEKSHVTDLIRDAGLEAVTASFRHGESQALAEDIRRRSQAFSGGEATSAWPEEERFSHWSEGSVLKKIIAALTGSGS